MELVSRLRLSAPTTKLVTIIAAFVLQAITVFFLYPQIGIFVGTFAMLPIVVGSTLFDHKGAVVTTILAIALHWTVGAAYMGYTTRELIAHAATVGIAASLIIGLLTSYRRGRKDLLQKRLTRSQDAVASDAHDLRVESRILEEEIQRRRAVEKTLRKENVRLENSSHAQRHFLASMSHELRTPLTMIMGQSDALREALYGALNPEQQAAVEQIFQSSDYLLKLIDRILDYNRLNTNNVTLQLDLIPIAMAGKAAIQFVAHLAHKKGIEIQFENLARGTVIEADDVQLVQILVNLLDNAIKFTPHNQQIGLSIALDEKGKRTAHSETPDGHVEISVWDQGIGISSDDIDSVFDAFVKLEKGQQGTGLGLSLVKQMVELHHGHIQVKSSPGEGSRFTIQLPINQPKNSSAQA